MNPEHPCPAIYEGTTLPAEHGCTCQLDHDHLLLDVPHLGIAKDGSLLRWWDRAKVKVAANG
jgi:hypothetical protein